MIIRRYRSPGCSSPVRSGLDRSAVSGPMDRQNIVMFTFASVFAFYLRLRIKLLSRPGNGGHASLIRWGGIKYITVPKPNYEQTSVAC